MWFKLDASGIKINLQIKNYKLTNRKNWDREWCHCDFLFYSDNWLNYHKENDEVLLCCEIDEISEALTRLLDNKIIEEKEIICIEPDFIFKLFPQKDLRDDARYTYVKPGYEIQDIYLEWRIYFWDDGLTDNYLTITLYRDEITRFRDYIELVRNQ